MLPPQLSLQFFNIYLLFFQNKRDREGKAFFECALNSHFVDDFINDDRPGLSGGLARYSRKQKTKQISLTNFIFPKVRGIYSRSVYNCFQPNKHESAWLSPNQYGRTFYPSDEYLSARASLNSRINCKLHKSAQFFLSHVTRNNCASAPRERSPSRKNSAAKFFVQKGMFNLLGSDRSASMIYYRNFIEMDSQQRSRNLRCVRARARSRIYDMASVKEGVHASANMYSRQNNR